LITAFANMKISFHKAWQITFKMIIMYYILENIFEFVWIDRQVNEFASLTSLVK